LSIHPCNSGGRGPGTEAADELAAAIADFLAGGLADFVYHD
jgi:hypothetical protein